MVSVLGKLLGDANEKAVKKVLPTVAKINDLETEFQTLADDQLGDKTSEFKARLARGESLDDLLPEAFAVAREAAKRRLGQRHYDVQLIGGAVLHRGEIAEMKTGEGKTLVATLPVYLNALSGQGVHVVTVNDYLARRDPVWMGPIYHALGLTVACLQHDAAYVYDPEAVGPNEILKSLRQVSRAEAYLADITYGTNNEFGFDYLRDNMAMELSQRVQRDLNYAIVDEVDNILIDEARTPLIISGPADEPVQQYYTFAKLAPRLQFEDDYTIDERTKSISLTQEGISKMERWTKVGNLYEPENFHLVHYIENALDAQVMKQRDKEYVVRDGEVVIVDEFTGRLQFGRRWSDGLHQAVEAKEGLKIQRESITYATITLQNYFRMYEKLAGMTGTAETEADEFHKIYRLEVTVIPTNMPMVRQNSSDLVFQTEEAKWRQVSENIAEFHQEGRACVGWDHVHRSVGESQRPAQTYRNPHQVLNAKNHEHEAAIVSQAGLPAAVTVSTNMAGRGDRHSPWAAAIPSALTGRPTTIRSYNWEACMSLARTTTDSRRIDNQLRGRSGRQGDPGSSQFYVSLEDELMRRFGGERIKSVMGWTGIDEDTPIENRLITKSIENAQVKVESYHFDIRKHLLDFDDVLNNQRQVIYTDRRRTLAGDNLKERILEMLRSEFVDLMGRHLADQHSDDWNVPEFLHALSLICPLPPDLNDEDQVYRFNRNEIRLKLLDYAETVYDNREKEIGADQMRIVERGLLLRAIDTHWVNHLTSMENLRTGIGLQAYGQRDPLVAYRTEGRKMFQDLTKRMQSGRGAHLFHVTVAQQPRNGNRRQAAAKESSPMEAVTARSRVAAPVGSAKVGRNAPCPCGSGKKYKRCHGASV